MRKRKKKNSFIPLLAFATLIGVGSFLLYKHFEKQIYTGPIALEPIPPTFQSYGIDISHHQGKIDWVLFKDRADSLIRFVYCKATEGTDFVDPQWENNRNHLTELNITHGAYHFFNPKTNPTTQATHFLKYYQSRQDDLPPVLDAETEGKSDQVLIDGMKEWLIRVEASTGKRPVIYTSYHFYNTKFKDAFTGYKFWIANYSNTPHRVKHNDIIHWQYSDLGEIPGIKNKVDLNYSKINFNYPR